MANGSTIRRTAGCLAAAPTFNTAVNLLYTNSAPMVTGSECPVSSTVLNDLTLQNTATVSLAANTTVNGMLTLGGENLLTAGNVLIMGGTSSRSRTSGHIIGIEQKNFPAPASFMFDVGTATGYSPATINVDSGTGDFSVSVTDGILAGTVPAETLNRYWTLTPNGITQADITVNYLNSDVPMGATVNQFSFIRRTGGTNFSFAPSSFNVLTRIFTLNNVTTFSDWTLSDLNPTAASVDVSGRIMDASGRAIGRAMVTMTDTQGVVHRALSSPFGYYRFTDVEAGGTYIFGVGHKLYTFPNTPRVVTINDAVDDIDFIGVPASDLLKPSDRIEQRDIGIKKP